MASIYKREWVGPDGKTRSGYQVRWKQIDGKVKRKLFPMRREADEWRRKVEPLEPRKVAITGITTTAKTIAEAMKEFLEASKLGINGRSSVENSTHFMWEKLSRVQVCPRWGHIRLETLTPTLARELRDRLIADKSVARTYQQQIWRHLKRGVDYMLLKGVFERNPLDGIIIYSEKGDGEEGDAVEIPSLEEAKAIVDRAKEWSLTAKNKKSRRHWKRSYVLMRLGFETGMRAGELAALPLRAVDLHLGTVKVIQTAKFSIKQIGRPKTRAANRTIKLSDSMTEDLRRWIEDERRCPDCDLVFGTERGKCLGYSNLRSEIWLRLLKDLGYLDDEGKVKYTLHSMRHFRASVLIRSGANQLEIMKELGHSKIETTLNHYGHLFREDHEKKRQRANAISAELFE